MEVGKLNVVRKEKKSKGGLHAVVIPWPSQGHINPMMHFSRWLASHGISITFVNTQCNHDRFISSWQEEENINLVAIPDGLPEDMPRSVYNICQGMVHHMGAPFERLLQNLLEDENHVIIIADLFISFVLDLAIKYGIPRISFWTQSASTFACHLAVARDAQNSACKDIVGIPGVPPMQFDDFPTLLSVFDLEDFMFDVSVTPFTRLNEVSCIVMNSNRNMEPDCLHSLYVEGIPIFTMGPKLPRKYFDPVELNVPMEFKGSISLWEEDASCVPWLNAQALGSVLYISFGSIVVLTLEQMEEFALGLEASGVPILWVMRPNLLQGESSILPKGFVERMGDRLQFVPWASQLEVLSHKSIGGFLTHCGWNSTMESVVKNIPMLCCPYFADQPLGQRLIVDLWQVGFEFVADDENGVVTRKEVEVKVKALMHGEEGKHKRNRINKLGEVVRRSVREEDGSSRLEFNQFPEVINGMMNHKKVINGT